MGFFISPAPRAAKLKLINNQPSPRLANARLLRRARLIINHFNNVYLRIAEEAHTEDSADAAGDKNAAFAFEIVEPCGHGGAEGNEISREGVSRLAAVRVAGEHEIPVELTQQPAAFRVVREEENGVRGLPGELHADSRVFITLVPISEADDAQGAA